MLNGAAVLKIPQADGSLKHISIPAERLWTKLGLVPSQLELRTRRLHWLQEIATHRADNKQLLAALFGQLEDEEHPTCENHLLTRNEDGQVRGNPWALQALNDLKLLVHVENGPELLAAMGHLHLKVFTDEFSKMFHKINFGKLRDRYWEGVIDEMGKRRVEVGGAVAGGGGGDQSEHDPLPPPRVWRCMETKADGTECGLEFHEQQGWYAHMRFSTEGSHGHRSLAQLLTVSNQCPWCMSTHSTIAISRQHVRRLFMKRSCQCDRSPMHHEPILPPTFECPACSKDHPSFEALQRHIRTHIDLSDATFSFTAPHGVGLADRPDGDGPG